MLAKEQINCPRNLIHFSKNNFQIIFKISRRTMIHHDDNTVHEITMKRDALPR